MSVHNPNTCANPMAPLQRFRCLRPDHANVWDEHVLARDYDTLAAERDQLAAENARLREALGETDTDLRVLASNIINAAASDPRWEGVASVVQGWIARNRAALAPATKEGQV